MRIFVSYARVNGERVEHLVNTLTQEHTVWLDREISPGQAWWDEITREIRDCDCFVVALTPDWLNSVFCRAEWDYARALEKPCLPVEIQPVDPLAVPPELNRLHRVVWNVQNQTKLMDAIRQQSPVVPKSPLPPTPPIPIEPLEQLAEQVRQLRLDFDGQTALLRQIRAYLGEGVWQVRALALLQEFHAHPNILAVVRDQIEALTPRLGTPRLMNRHESNQYESYSDFLDKANETIHNFGAGLASVGQHLRGYEAAIKRGVRLHFMQLDPDIVNDATARFFSKHRRDTIRREIDTTYTEHLRQLYEYARKLYPSDYYRHVEFRWRQTGPDIGILARDLDTPHGVMRVEFYVYDTNADQWPGLLLYPHHKLYQIYRRAVLRLWGESYQPVGAILISSQHPGQVLLTRRSLEPFNGLWCLPGGHLEVGEYKRDGILREVQEEIGVSFDPHYFDSFEENFPEIDHYVWVNIFVGELTSEDFVRQEDEVAEIRWFDLDEACAMPMAFGHDRVLRAYRDKRG